MRHNAQWEVRCCEGIARGLLREARRHLRSGLAKQAESTTRHARVWWREANRVRRLRAASAYAGDGASLTATLRYNNARQMLGLVVDLLDEIEREHMSK